MKRRRNIYAVVDANRYATAGQLSAFLGGLRIARVMIAVLIVDEKDRIKVKQSKKGSQERLSQLRELEKEMIAVAWEEHEARWKASREKDAQDKAARKAGRLPSQELVEWPELKAAEEKTRAVEAKIFKLYEEYTKKRGI